MRHAQIKQKKCLIASLRVDFKSNQQRAYPGRGSVAYAQRTGRTGDPPDLIKSNFKQRRASPKRGSVASARQKTGDGETQKGTR